MFSRLSNIFKKVEDDNNRRAVEFLEFYRYCIKTFPRLLKERLRQSHLSPCVKGVTPQESDTYEINFKLSDILWWEGIIEAEQPYFKDLSEFKKEVLRAALGALDNLRLSDEEYQKCLDELGSDLDTMKKNTQK